MTLLIDKHPFIFLTLTIIICIIIALPIAYLLDSDKRKCEGVNGRFISQGHLCIKQSVVIPIK